MQALILHKKSNQHVFETAIPPVNVTVQEAVEEVKVPVRPVANPLPMLPTKNPDPEIEPDDVFTEAMIVPDELFQVVDAVVIAVRRVDELVVW